MENIIVSLFCVGLILVTGMTLSMNSLHSIDMLTDTWKKEQSQSEYIRGTSIKYISSITQNNGSLVETMIMNDGNKTLAHFLKWDVIVWYQDGYVQWIPYTTSTPGWNISGIYLNGNPEIYEKNILNPGETLKLIIRLSPPVAKNTINYATVSSDNGAGTQCTFGWK